MKISVNLTAYNHTEHGVGSYIVKLATVPGLRLDFLLQVRVVEVKLVAFRSLLYGKRGWNSPLSWTL